MDLLHSFSRHAGRVDRAQQYRPSVVLYCVRPLPYIFLNLMLSMLAALQAPVILMSQNRQAARDRLAAGHDYEVNLKAELEIMLLHDKIDLLREGQWRELLALQGEQLKLLRDVLRKTA